MAHLEQPQEMPSDWRTELSSETRDNVVNRITETRRKYVAVSDREKTKESRNIAQSFEATTYDTAASQSDYWKIITQWCLAMEATRPNSPAPDATGSNVDMAPGSQEMLERVHRHWADKVRRFYGFYSAGFSEIFCKYCCWGTKIYCQLHHHVSGLGGGGVAPCEVARPWAREVGLVAVGTEPADDGPDYRAVFDAFDRHESRNIGEVRSPLMAFHDIVEAVEALKRTIQEKLVPNSKRKRARRT